MRTLKIRWGLWIFLMGNTKYFIDERYPVYVNFQINEDAVKKGFAGATTAVEVHIGDVNVEV